MKPPKAGDIAKETGKYVAYWCESHYPDEPLTQSKENKYPCVGGLFAGQCKCATQVAGKGYFGFNRAGYARRGGMVPKKAWVHQALLGLTDPR